MLRGFPIIGIPFFDNNNDDDDRDNINNIAFVTINTLEYY